MISRTFILSFLLISNIGFGQPTKWREFMFDIGHNYFGLTENNVKVKFSSCREYKCYVGVDSNNIIISVENSFDALKHFGVDSSVINGLFTSIKININIKEEKKVIYITNLKQSLERYYLGEIMGFADVEYFLLCPNQEIVYTKVSNVDKRIIDVIDLRQYRLIKKK